MKRLHLLFTTGILLASILSIRAQTLDEVISKHVEAIGGKEKLLALRSVVTEANLVVQGTDIQVKLTQVHNKGQRVDITAMGTANYIINTPTEGWTFMPIQGHTAPEQMPAAAVKEAVDGLDLQGILLNYKEKGHQVELTGKEDVDGTACFRIGIKLKGGSEQTAFINSTNYYIVKLINKTKGTGQEVEQTQTFSNYKKLDSGYVFPFFMTGFGPGELTVSKVEVNVPVDEKIFTRE